LNKSCQPLVWILNLDAEDELRSLGPYCRSRATESLIAQQVPALRESLLDPKDYVFGESVPQGTRGIAWSPTPSSLQIIKEQGWEHVDHASIDVIRRVNNKGFLVDQHTALEGAENDLPRFKFEQWSHLQAMLAQQPKAQWWVRSTLACAGRHRLRVAWESIDERQEKWLIKACAQTGVTVQPFVTILKEVSTSGWIGRDGTVLIADPRVQETGNTGVWSESLGRYAADSQDSPNFHGVGRSIANSLVGAGYFGPFGLDSFAYKNGDSAPNWHLYSDLNARFTMDWGLSFRIQNLESGVTAHVR